MSNSHAQQVQEIKAVLEQMKISERQWAKEQSEQNKINHPSAQSKTNKEMK